MGTHPIFESDFDCLTEMSRMSALSQQYKAAIGRIAADLEQVGETWNTVDLAHLEQAVPESNEFAALKFEIKIEREKLEKKDCETQAWLTFAKTLDHSYP